MLEIWIEPPAAVSNFSLMWVHYPKEKVRCRDNVKWQLIELKLWSNQMTWVKNYIIIAESTQESQEHSGAIWRPLEQPGSMDLELSGAPWSSLQQFGAIWIDLEDFWAFWSHLDPGPDAMSNWNGLSWIDWVVETVINGIWTKLDPCIPLKSTRK